MRLGLGLGLFKAGLISAGVRIFSAFQTRVIGDGGTVESGTCVVNGINNSSILQQASLLLIPSGYKGGKLYAEIPTNGNGDLTWTRGSDAFRTNASGVLQRVPWNLLQRSEEFDNAIWTKTGCSITTNTTTAPNATTTADKLVSTNLATGCSVYQQGTIIANATYTFSIYVKASGANWIQLIATGTTISSPARLWVDLSSGALGTNNGGFSIASVTNAGDGWYRVSGSFTVSSTATFSNLFCALATGDNINGFNGDGTSGIFIWGAQLVEGTTAQTYLPTTDRLNFPRLSYMYGSCPAVLLEPQRTNLCLFSDDFTNSGWTKTNTTATANTTTSPDGTLNADTITITNSGSNLLLRQITVTASTTYTFSFWALRGTATDLKYLVYNYSGASILVASTSYYSQTNSSTWSRISVTFTTPVGCTLIGVYPLFDVVSLGTFYIYGAQLEAGAYPTTYIPTTSATATRVADSASKTGISSLIGQTEGTVFLDFIFKASDSNVGGQIGISDSAKANRVILWNNSSFNSLAIQLKANNSNAIAVSLGTFVDGTRYKIAIAYKSGDTVVYVNGTQTITNSASFTFSSSLTDFILGGYETTMASGHQFCFKTALFTSRLSNSDLATLTT